MARPRRAVDFEEIVTASKVVVLSHAFPSVGRKVTRSAVRNRRVIRATPEWADLQEIERIYSKARERSRRTGIPHHVDHEVPIYGGTVCGLHVENNLRIIPVSDNVRRPRRWTSNE